jgi:hypothetical protein
MCLICYMRPANFGGRPIIFIVSLNPVALCGNTILVLTCDLLLSNRSCTMRSNNKVKSKTII